MNQSFCIFDILQQTVAVVLPFRFFVVFLRLGNRPRKNLATMFESFLFLPAYSSDVGR